MRIDYVNQQIMDAMLQGYPMPRYDTITAPVKETLYIISTDGLVAYVLEESEIYFNLARCRNEPGVFKVLTEDDTHLRIDNMLEPTLDIRVSHSGHTALSAFLTGESMAKMLTRFKGATWDTFVNMDLLEAFDYAKYYQAKENGPIAVVEDGALVGYVMPVKPGSAAGHYTDSPSNENPLIEDEEE